MRKPLELTIPPVGVFLICAAAMWLLSSAAPGWDFVIPGRTLLVTLVAGAGVAAGIAGVLAFRAAKTTVDPRYPEKASTIVRTGVYRWSRNPMYLGLLLMLSAWAIYLAHGVAFVLLPGFVLYMNRFQISPEERAMQSSFGNEYRDYCKAVRRWI